MELLKGKTAMVTGGTRGIGYAVVKVYLENGAKVALCGSRQETVDKALEKLKAENPDYEVIGLCPDLMNPEEVEKAVATVKDTFGGLDIMVNNAGVSARESIYDYKPEDFAKTMNLNVDAVFNYDVPDENEYYIHRIGRTGRAKRHGVAFSLVSSVTEGLRLDEIRKNTGNEIVFVRFNERGDLVAPSQS